MQNAEQLATWQRYRDRAYALTADEWETILDLLQREVSTSLAAVISFPDSPRARARAGGEARQLERILNKLRGGPPLE